jgi:hypothetical protein
LIKKSQTAKQKRKQNKISSDLRSNKTDVQNENNLPKENFRSRKRQRNESEWKRNVAKRRRNEGKSYVNKLGQLTNCRQMKPGCNIIVSINVS